MNFGGIDGVAEIVAFAVGNVSDEVFTLAELMDDELDNVDILHFVMAADVIDLPYSAVLEDKVDGFAMIFNIKPVAYIETLPVDRERFVVETVDDHERNELFGEMIGAIVVAATGNSRREAVSTMVGLDEKVSPGFGGGIGRRGVDGGGLGEEKIRTV